MTEQTKTKSAMHSESIELLISSLVAFQLVVPTIEKNQTVTVYPKRGGSYEFKYADLTDIMSVIRPLLAANGLVIMQNVKGDFLVTYLMHTSGQWMLSYMPLTKTTDPQKYGSELTYKRRYSVTAMLGLVTDDDDDGNAAEGNTVVSTANNGVPPQQTGNISRQYNNQNNNSHYSSQNNNNYPQNQNNQHNYQQKPKKYISQPIGNNRRKQPDSNKPDLPWLNLDNNMIQQIEERLFHYSETPNKILSDLGRDYKINRRDKEIISAMRTY